MLFLLVSRQAWKAKTGEYTPSARAVFIMLLRNGGRLGGKAVLRQLRLNANATIISINSTLIRATLNPAFFTLARDFNVGFKGLQYETLVEMQQR